MPTPSTLSAVAKSVDMADAAPRAWEPSSGCAEWLEVDANRIRHIRGGASDAARGTHQIQNGRFTITYRVNHAAHRVTGFGIVLGVADMTGAAWETPPPGGPATAKHKPIKPTVAWGVCPSSGKVIQTHNANIGCYGGAQQLGWSLIDRHMGKPIAGTTITVECDIPAHPTVEDAAIARRNFSSRLHPLDAERAFPLHMQSMKSRSVQHLTSPVVRPSSLAFRINGSELLRTNVQLPAGGVYPWVLLTSDGDDVTLVSVTAHDAGD